MDRRPVGLMEHVKARARAQTAPICAMVLLGGRSMARNRDCQDDLTLAQADAGSAPRSARLREALASSLFERDPVRNLDAAIHEGETAMEIMRPLPADKVFQQTPARPPGELLSDERRCSRRGGEPRVVRKIAARPAGRPRSVAGHRTGLRPGAVDAPQATGYARRLSAGLSGTGDHAYETGEEWRGDGCIPLWKTVMEGRSILVPRQFTI